MIESLLAVLQADGHLGRTGGQADERPVGDEARRLDAGGGVLQSVPLNRRECRSTGVGTVCERIEGGGRIGVGERSRQGGLIRHAILREQPLAAVRLRQCRVPVVRELELRPHSSHVITRLGRDDRRSQVPQEAVGDDHIGRACLGSDKERVGARHEQHLLLRILPPESVALRELSVGKQLEPFAHCLRGARIQAVRSSLGKQLIAGELILQVDSREQGGRRQ